MDITIAIAMGKSKLLSLNRMRASKSASKRKSGRTSKGAKTRPVSKIRSGVESMDGFFSHAG
jgi:hypothetical protein